MNEAPKVICGYIEEDEEIPEGYRVEGYLIAPDEPNKRTSKVLLLAKEWRFIRCHDGIKGMTEREKL